MEYVKTLFIFLVLLLTIPMVSSNVFANPNDSLIETSIFYGMYLHDVDEHYLYHGKPLSIAPILHVNGRNKGYRKIHMRFEDSNGNIFQQNWAYTTLLGIPKFFINTKKLHKGTYKITLWYNGNKRNHWPPTKRTIKIHLI